MKKEAKNIETPEVVEDEPVTALATQAAQLPAANDMDEYIKIANELHANISMTVSQIQGLQRLAISNALNLGYLLTYVRENCKHGQWLKLFRGSRSGKNASHVMHFEFSEHTARRFMASYTNLSALALARGGEERKGQLMLQLQDFGSSGGNVVRVDDLTDAKTLTQFYIDLGIVPSRKGVTPDKVPAAMQQQEAQQQGRTEQHAMEAAAYIVNLLNGWAAHDARLCKATFCGEIATQLADHARAIAKAGIPSA